MKDTFGRELEAGQLVALAGSSAASPFLSIGRVVGPCKEGTGVRVRVIHSSSLAFQRGHRRWKGEVTREREQPYVATFQCSERVVIIDGAVVPLPEEPAG